MEYQNDEYQTYIPNDDVAGFNLSANSYVGENEMTLDGADYILGLGNKRKKAEKKIRKAEKLMAQGKIGKAEKKLAKADKKLVKSKTADLDTISNLSNAQKDLAALKDTKTQALNDARQAGQQSVLPSGFQPITPSTQDVSAQIGDTSGQLGDMSAMGAGGGGSPDFQTPDAPTDDSTLSGDVLPGVTVTNSTKSKLGIVPILIGVAVVGLVLFFAFKKHKK